MILHGVLENRAPNMFCLYICMFLFMQSPAIHTWKVVGDPVILGDLSEPILIFGSQFFISKKKKKKREKEKEREMTQTSHKFSCYFSQFFSQILSYFS